jgi:hypothetical protein
MATIEVLLGYTKPSLGGDSDDHLRFGKQIRQFGDGQIGFRRFSQTMSFRRGLVLAHRSFSLSHCRSSGVLPPRAGQWCRSWRSSPPPLVRCHPAPVETAACRCFHPCPATPSQHTLGARPPSPCPDAQNPVIAPPRSPRPSRRPGRAGEASRMSRAAATVPGWANHRPARLRPLR